MIRFEELSEDEKQDVAEMLFAPLDSAQALKDWVRAFLGLELPLEITDPDSTSSPLDAIWQVYNTFKHNAGDITPGYIFLSAREGMKTVSVAILELLLMLHNKLEIAHAAAVEAQSSVGLGYITEFVSKIKPIMDYVGWKQDVQNKRTIKFKTPDGKSTYVKVLVCTVKGMNSLHVNALFLDELDLADPKALKQARNIVGYSKGIYGVMVYLSTRKFAFGNMNEAIDAAPEKNHKILRWNLLDVTESCPPSRHKPDLPRVDRYVAKNLPLKQISVEEFTHLPGVEQKKYELVKDAYAGCVSCHLFPVCKTRLTLKPSTATKGFYKPIVSVINTFKNNDPDTAEAELMCWKPGSTGLVYPRFSSSTEKGNVISLSDAYFELTGRKHVAVTESLLIAIMKSLQIPFVAGVDWGFTHDFTIIIAALLPNGQVWLMDSFAAPGLETEDKVSAAIAYRDRYEPTQWFGDPADPASMKTFSKNGMKMIKFKKDVMAGIEAIRSKILNSRGDRNLKVLFRDENKKLISAISKHYFKLDGQGNPTQSPDDVKGIADLCDALRYIGQNKFPSYGRHQLIISGSSGSAKPTQNIEEIKKNDYEKAMREELATTILSSGGTLSNSGKKGSIFWNF